MVTTKHFGIEIKFINISVLTISMMPLYDMSDDNIVNLGLKDKPFFKASADYQSKMKKPFYSHLITLTNHYPFTLDEEDASIDKPNTGDSTVDGYIQTAHYLDQALEEYITDLKKKVYMIIQSL